MNVGDRITEAICDHFGRETLDEGGAQCLIPALPIVYGMEEEVFVAHDKKLIAYAVYNVNNKMP